MILDDKSDRPTVLTDGERHDCGCNNLLQLERTTVRQVEGDTGKPENRRPGINPKHHDGGSERMADGGVSTGSVKGLVGLLRIGNWHERLQPIHKVFRGNEYAANDTVGKRFAEVGNAI